jgi:hypothetical protein
MGQGAWLAAVKSRASTFLPGAFDRAGARFVFSLEWPDGGGGGRSPDAVWGRTDEAIRTRTWWVAVRQVKSRASTLLVWPAWA